MKPTAALFAGVFLAAGLLAGCGQPGPSLSAPADSAPEAVEAVSPDQAAALIDAIYVQQRTDDTDAQCTAAKAAWDALTDAQKALVSGKNASPDYFGLDTGDASRDDPRNADGIGEKEILVVSFGTSYVVLRPLMVVAGDHAWNDMSGEDPDSWKSLFTAAGFAVETQMTGLGSVPGVQQLYVDHTGAAMAAL